MKALYLLASVTIGVLLGYPVEVYSEPKIIFAAVLYRHGARTPIDPYPLDPYKNESLWPEKFGQLVNEGKKEHYMLGGWLRKRYQHLVSTNYDPDEVCIQSTSVDRTIMSAQINTASLYPPRGKEVWNDKLKWQPVPIRTVAAEDHVLAMNKYCPAYQNEKEKFHKSKEYKDKLAQYKKLMEYVSEHSGRKISNFSDLEYVYSTLHIESFLGFELPEWTREVYPDQMKEPSCYSFTLQTATATMARLRAGPLLKEITENMMSAKFGKSKAKKLYVYSAHDDTVASLLNVLRVFDGKCPNFTATVFIELFADDSLASAAAPFVRVSYRNSPDIVEPEVLTVPGCTQHCHIDTFLQLYNNVTDVDIDNDCILEDVQHRMRSNTYWMLNYIVLCTIVFLLIALTSFRRSNK